MSAQPADFLQKHYQYFQECHHWQAKAVKLRRAAKVLYKDILPDLRRYEKARRVALKKLEKRSVVPIEYVEPDFFPAVALYGLALENVFKGLMISKDSSLIGKSRLSDKIRLHRLAALAGKAGVSLSADEKYLLEWTSEVVIWKGRYSVPTNYIGAQFPFHQLDNVTLANARKCMRLLDGLFARSIKLFPKRRRATKFGVLVRLEDD